VVIDTGLSTADNDFVSALSDVLDPAAVRWVWITHPDRDHTGGLWALLEAAPARRHPAPAACRVPPALLVRYLLHHKGLSRPGCVGAQTQAG
jgi:glyoxylase-like metal-dependent hydrolase (beta-lactamase superfamily II)